MDSFRRRRVQQQDSKSPAATEDYRGNAGCLFLSVTFLRHLNY